MAASSYTLLDTSLPPLVSSNPSSKTLLVLARIHGRRSLPPLRRSTAPSRFRSVRCSGSGDKSPAAGDNNSSFCIIEGPETVQDFVQMQLQEIQDNIKSRRNKIFLLMEEVRRLRIQQRIKTAECSSDRCEDNEMPDIPSTLPFLPHLTPKTLRQLYLTSFALSFGIILFGGLLAPVINADEAWNTTIGGGSLGYLVRASVGKCSLAVAAYAAGSSALDIELTAIRSTLHHIYCNHHDGTTKWIIESDCQRTIELIHDKDESPAASFAQLPKEIRFILSGINTYTLIYTLSEFNEPANWLTIFAKNSALELKLGLGGTSYEDFIRNMHLPLQLSQVDPIVASFSGGAVGVISALMLLEANNVQQQEKKRCTYCHGTGYLACARCSARGLFLNIGPISISDGCNDSVLSSTTQRCPNCSGTGKVMCPTCLCTGTAMASEHDPRIDPFDI